MRLGAIFPHYEIGSDPVAIRDWAQAAEDLGYDHILAYDHVLGANAETHKELTGPYRHNHAFHEPFVLFGHLSAVTNKIELATGIIILPQRQTVLVAKQAATVDVLSNGRLRLGIGLGWNPVEYDALGEEFKNRGRRVEEQIDVMRQLWCNELVTYEGQWHTIPDAGINPLPVQRPIPVWFGAFAPPAIRRAARWGDGWIAMGMLKESTALLDVFQKGAEDAGRDPAQIGLETLIALKDDGPEEWVQLAQRYKNLGATHLDANPLGAGFHTAQQHIDGIRHFRLVRDDPRRSRRRRIGQGIKLNAIAPGKTETARVAEGRVDSILGEHLDAFSMPIPIHD